jgi:hypothetical protein
MLFAAVSATSASDIERHGYKVANVEEFNVAALFDHFSGDLALRSAGFSCGAPSDHVLIRTATVGRNDFEDNCVVDFASVRISNLGSGIS